MNTTDEVSFSYKNVLSDFFDTVVLKSMFDNPAFDVFCVAPLVFKVSVVRGNSDELICFGLVGVLDFSLRVVTKSEDDVITFLVFIANKVVIGEELRSLSIGNLVAEGCLFVAFDVDLKFSCKVEVVIVFL